MNGALQTEEVVKSYLWGCFVKSYRTLVTSSHYTVCKNRRRYYATILDFPRRPCQHLSNMDKLYMSYFFGPLTHIVSCLQKMSDDTLIIIDINVKNVTKRPNRRSKSTLTGTSWSLMVDLLLSIFSIGRHSRERSRDAAEMSSGWCRSSASPTRWPLLLSSFCDWWSMAAVA